MASEKEVVETVLNLSKLRSLNPVQEEAVRKGLLEGKSLVVCSPTASGKTLIAELAMVNAFLNKLGKCIYLTPLVALASEKYREFKEKYGKLGVKVAISVGNFDSCDPWLANYDWIVVSNEKMDSLIRHGADWIRDVALVVCDEIHMLTDVTRGPTLEMVLTRLLQIVPNAQVLGLSATIKNAEEIAAWLGASVVRSDWRPVKLYLGVCFPWRVKFLEKEGYELDENLSLEEGIADKILSMGKQVLFFVSTRKAAESLAEKLGKTVSKKLSKVEKEHLKKLAEEIRSCLETPTRQCEREATCVSRGVAFHHAGLVFKQRQLIEDNFRKGILKAIVATPTLAYGVNLPSFCVVLRDLRRYAPGRGVIYVPVLEVQQMLGRAGRPRYDDYGEGIVIAKSEDDGKEIVEHYLYGEPEEITSKLAVEPVLRMHCLALIASDFCRSVDSLLRFLSKTFYAFQYGSSFEIEEKVKEVVDTLEKWGFVEKSDDKLKATPLGKRVSQLYIDPQTAHLFVKGLKAMRERKLEKDFCFLFLISSALEMRPWLSVKLGEYSELGEILLKREEELPFPPPEEYDVEYEIFLRKLKTALMLSSWIEEATEDFILSEFGVTPGELRGRLEIADWLVYSLSEISLLLGFKQFLKHLRKLRVRLEYGVKEELLPLVRLKNIGRKRARMLWDRGFRKLSDLREVPLPLLAEVVGPAVAASVKRQLGEESVKKPPEERQKTLEESF